MNPPIPQDLYKPDGNYDLNAFDWFAIVKRGDNLLYSVCDAPQHISHNKDVLSQAEVEVQKQLKATTENAVFVFFRQIGPKDTLLLVFPGTPEQVQDVETRALNGLVRVGYRSIRDRRLNIKA